MAQITGQSDSMWPSPANFPPGTHSVSAIVTGTTMAVVMGPALGAAGKTHIV